MKRLIVTYAPDGPGQLTHDVLLAALLVVGFLAVIYLFWRLFGSPGQSPGNGCRWRRDGAGARGRFGRWVCDACNETGYGFAGRPPRTCKRGIGHTGL